MVIRNNKIKNIRIKNYMIFDSLDLDFSKDINIICGENSTGKTVLLKIIYSILKSYRDAEKDKNPSVETFERYLLEKIQGVFRPDNNNIVRLINRTAGESKSEILMKLDGVPDHEAKFEINRQGDKRLSVSIDDYNVNVKTISEPIYIPPKEIISTMENFGSLYREYQIAFEETYADLCYLLEKPLKKSLTKEEMGIIKRIEDILQGKVVQREKKIYLEISNVSNFEMGVLSEGYRKLSTLVSLIKSGSLDRNSIVFWDEPESNMNPKMITMVASVLCDLANIGVQVFVATHSYFVQQAFDLYGRKNKDKNLDIRFYSLYHEDKSLRVAEACAINELDHNSIMEEFDAVYDREQDLFYDRID